MLKIFTVSCRGKKCKSYLFKSTIIFLSSARIRGWQKIISRKRKTFFKISFTVVNKFFNAALSNDHNKR